MAWTNLREELEEEFGALSARQDEALAVLELRAARRKVTVAEYKREWRRLKRLDKVWVAKERARDRRYYRPRTARAEATMRTREAIGALLLAGLSGAEVSRTLGLCQDTVSHHRLALGLGRADVTIPLQSKRKGRKLPPEQADRLRAALPYATNAELSRAFGITVPGVRYHRLLAGLPAPTAATRQLALSSHLRPCAAE